MTVDIFYTTGFDINNIPSNAELLYNGEFDYDSYENMDLIQSDWLAYLTVQDDRLDYIRNADYAIVYDEDKNTRTCYIIDHYQMVTSNTVKYILVMDPLATAGGFEPADGHEPIVVQGGSVNRISVPLTKATNHHDFMQCEDDTFFTLEEPFQPSNRLVHTTQQFDPLPGPGPQPTPGGGLTPEEADEYAENIIIPNQCVFTAQQMGYKFDNGWLKSASGLGNITFHLDQSGSRYGGIGLTLASGYTAIGTTAEDVLENERLAYKMIITRILQGCPSTSLFPDFQTELNNAINYLYDKLIDKFITRGETPLVGGGGRIWMYLRVFNGTKHKYREYDVNNNPRNVSTTTQYTYNFTDPTIYFYVEALNQYGSTYRFIVPVGGTIFDI